MTLTWHVDVAATDGTLQTSGGDEEIESGELHLECEGQGSINMAVASVPMTIKDTERIFVNGYQTWTYCPEYTPNDRIRGIKRIPSRIREVYGLDCYSDYHFVDYPYKRGVTHGFSWFYLRDGHHYRFVGSLNERTGYTMFQYDANIGILTIEKDCKGLVINGTYNVFDLYFAEGTEEEVFDGWFKALGIKPRVNQKLAGYSSWYNRYQNIDEAAIRQDLKGCKDIFEPGDLFQIDDGWEPFVGDWLKPDKKKFPGGMKKMADEIHDAGFKAGLWLAPFVAETNSELYKKHQDWFLKVDGKPWKDGSNWSGFYSLDVDNPKVIDYLTRVFRQVFDDWGFDLVKLDFLYGAAPFGNTSETRAGKMIRMMEFLRELAGDKLILGCGVPVMPAFGLVDYCRISCDVSLDWDDKFYMRLIHRERVSTKQAVGNIFSRRQLNGRAYLSDPDVFFLRDDNLQLSETRKQSLCELDVLMGGLWLTSDDPSSYTEARKKDYRKYRRLLDAKNVTFDPVSGEISYELDGNLETFKPLFDERRRRIPLPSLLSRCRKTSKK